MRQAFALTPAGRSLLWQSWGDDHLIYQPSSTETHVFNETTACALRRLTAGAATLDEVAEWSADAMGIERNLISAKDFEFVMARLEELGLIDAADEVTATL
jgi:PqqD family protein of HPr-rel-A system